MKFLITTCLLLVSLSCFSQKKIYFLADTINVPKGNRILEIVSGAYPQRNYSFYCTCLPPYRFYVTFSYMTGHKLGIIVNEKPSFQYISWKELQDIIVDVKYDFDRRYELYITEVLPGNRYRTNKVELAKPDQAQTTHKREQ